MHKLRETRRLISEAIGVAAFAFSVGHRSISRASMALAAETAATTGESEFYRFVACWFEPSNTIQFGLPRFATHNSDPAATNLN